MAKEYNSLIKSNTYDSLTTRKVCGQMSMGVQD